MWCVVTGSPLARARTIRSMALPSAGTRSLNWSYMCWLVSLTGGGGR
jgi:hypothetical protein